MEDILKSFSKWWKNPRSRFYRFVLIISYIIIFFSFLRNLDVFFNIIISGPYKREWKIPYLSLKDLLNFIVPAILVIVAWFSYTIYKTTNFIATVLKFFGELINFLFLLVEISITLFLSVIIFDIKYTGTNISFILVLYGFVFYITIEIIKKYFIKLINKYTKL